MNVTVGFNFRTCRVSFLSLTPADNPSPISRSSSLMRIL